MNIIEKIKEILSKLSGMTDIRPESHLQNDLGLDSLHMVIMLLDIEEEFGIVLDEGDMNPFELSTVSDTVMLVQKYKEKCAYPHNWKRQYSPRGLNRL